MREGHVMRRSLPALALALMIALVGVTWTLEAAPQPASRAASTIVIGEISEEPSRKIRAFQPLADYLAAHLGKFGITAGHVRVPPDLATMALLLRSGEMALYFDSPYPALIAIDQSGATPILRRWKGGVAEYHSVFFTRADSGLTSLADLNGKVVGFEDSHSTSGYFLPLVHLLKAGMKPVERPSVDSAVLRDEVGYVFSGHERNTVHWVLGRRLVAGAIDNITYSKIPEEIRTSLKILAETELVPRHIVLARPVMASALLAAIKTLLMDMHKTPEGQGVLRAFENTARFDEFPAAAEVGRMREMFKLVKSR